MTSREDFSVDTLRSLVAASARACSIGCTVRGSDMRFRIVNSVAAMINNTTPEDHVGKTAADILGTVGDQVETLLCQVVASGKPVAGSVSGRLARRTDEGEWIVRYVPIKNIFGHVKMIAGLIIEVSAQRKIERGLVTLDEQDLIIPQMKDWAAELRESLSLFDYAMYQTLTELSTPMRDPQQFPERVRMLDYRVGVIKNLLSAQAHWLADAKSGASWLN